MPQGDTVSIREEQHHFAPAFIESELSLAKTTAPRAVHENVDAVVGLGWHPNRLTPLTSAHDIPLTIGIG